MIVVGGRAFDGACGLFLLGSLQGLREHVAGSGWNHTTSISGLHRDNAPCRHDRAEDAKARQDQSSFLEAACGPAQNEPASSYQR